MLMASGLAGLQQRGLFRRRIMQVRHLRKTAARVFIAASATVFAAGPVPADKPDRPGGILPIAVGTGGVIGAIEDLGRM